MADVDFEDLLEEEQLDLPEVPEYLEPPAEIQRTIEEAGSNITQLRGELKEQEIEAQRDRMVKAFYDAVEIKKGDEIKGSL